MSTSCSLANGQSCQMFNQNLLLLFIFSFSYFALSSSRAISFVFKYLSASLLRRGLIGYEGAKPLHDATPNMAVNRGGGV